MQDVEYTEEGDGIVLPAVDREEFELPASAYGAKVKHDKDGNATAVTLPKDRVLKFAKPGGRVSGKRLYTIKAIKPDGAVIQIPLEPQINNNVASPENALGAQFYSRKGYQVLLDIATGEVVFCPTADCWAASNPQHGKFCCEAHKALTAPEAPDSGFSANATTSANTWRI